MDRLLDASLGKTEHLAERPGPEDLADDRSRLDEDLLVGRERVEPGRDDALHGLRERQFLLGLGEQAHELLRVERISAGASQELAPTLALETEIRDAIEFYYGSTDTKQPAPAEQPSPAASALTETKFQSLLKLLLDKGVLTLREYERMR